MRHFLPVDFIFPDTPSTMPGLNRLLTAISGVAMLSRALSSAYEPSLFESYDSSYLLDNGGESWDTSSIDFQPNPIEVQDDLSFYLEPDPSVTEWDAEWLVSNDDAIFTDSETENSCPVIGKNRHRRRQTCYLESSMIGEIVTDPIPQEVASDLVPQEVTSDLVPQVLASAPGFAWEDTREPVYPDISRPRACFVITPNLLCCSGPFTRSRRNFFNIAYGCKPCSFPRFPRAPSTDSVAFYCFLRREIS
jgi:hypothetical protein